MAGSFCKLRLYKKSILQKKQNGKITAANISDHPHISGHSAVPCREQWLKKGKFIIKFMMLCSDHLLIRFNYTYV